MTAALPTLEDLEAARRATSLLIAATRNEIVAEEIRAEIEARRPRPILPIPETITNRNHEAIRPF